MRPIAASMILAMVLVAGCAESGHPPSAGRSVADVALASAVDLRITGCRIEPVRGAGSMIAISMAAGANGDRYILTAAHVVAGAESITARAAGAGAQAVDAMLVAIDPVNDLALLDSDLALPALQLAGLATGEEGVAVVFVDEVATVRPFSIVNPVIVNILDIYGKNKISRPGYRVAIAIEPGDSGAVLVGAGGVGGGVLYAKSRGSDANAFATNMSAVPALIEAAADADPVKGIDTGDCP